MNDKRNFINVSEDKKTLTLVVGLGERVYEFHTACNDCCTYLDDYKERIPGAKCESMSVCHTVPYAVEEIVVSLSSVEYINKYWHKTIFETEALAQAAMDEMIKNNIAVCEKEGIKLDENGRYLNE